MKQLNVILIVLSDYWQPRFDLYMFEVCNVPKLILSIQLFPKASKLFNKPFSLGRGSSDVCDLMELFFNRWNFIASPNVVSNDSRLRKVYKSRATGDTISHLRGDSRSDIMKFFIVILLSLIPFSYGNFHFYLCQFVTANDRVINFYNFFFHYSLSGHKNLFLFHQQIRRK